MISDYKETLLEALGDYRLWFDGSAGERAEDKLEIIDGAIGEVSKL